MRKVGKRNEQVMTALASGDSLAQGAIFCEALAALAGTISMPIDKLKIQRVFRFKSHEDANLFDEDRLARSMALRAMGRLKVHVK